MTLNQIIARIRTLALAHKQIRRFKTGLAGDWFADRTAKYPACCLQYSAGVISTASHIVGVNFRLFLMDLVHVSKDTKDNQDDVLSDMLSIIMDLVSEINAPAYGDWVLSTDNNLNPIIEGENDLAAGWYIDFTIQAPFTQNICQIPTDVFDFPDDNNDGPVFPGTDLKALFDVIYYADGTEGVTLNIPIVSGKKVMALATRENNPIYKVSSNPDEAEFSVNNSVITLGVPVSKARERFLFLYRNI